MPVHEKKGFIMQHQLKYIANIEQYMMSDAFTRDYVEKNFLLSRSRYQTHSICIEYVVTISL